MRSYNNGFKISARLVAGGAALALASVVGAQAAAAQESDTYYGPIQDNVAGLLNDRGIDYEFDGADLPFFVVVEVEEVAVEAAPAPAPMPAPPVQSTSAEPAAGSEGVPVEDPF